MPPTAARALVVGFADRSPQAVSAHTGHGHYRFRPPGGRKVPAIDFEWSPGRGNERYTGDRSAFDAYVQFRNDEGGPGF